MDPAPLPTRSRAPHAPRAVLFDAFGTLFDVYSVSTLAEQLFPGHGERLSVLWRDKQIEYTRLASMSGAHGEHYRPFWEITRAGLRYAALRLGLALDAAAEDRLMNQYHHLSSFPENKPVLQALKARGVPAGILSNGDPQMLAVAVKSAGLDGLLDPLISVHDTRRYKTDPAAYALGPASAEAAGARHPVRLQQRLGRHRRHLVRLHHAVGQPRRRAAGTAGHRTDAHRQQPARGARFLSHPFEPNDAMTERTTVHRLQVATELLRFIEDQVLPGTGIEAATFWQGFDQIVHDLAPEERRACWPSATGCRPRSTPGTRPTRARSGTCASTAPSCRRSATWCRCRPRSR